ncbi:hypothetical protein FACS189419_00330 [Planctomycetales bacterium]|nr:hypothetical protein FACS189419_00330 [Planctomycetales bacterium]
MFFRASISQRTVAVEHFTEHTVRCFGKRIKDNAQGFCADDFVIGAVIADNKIPSAILAFVALLAASETALVKMFRMTMFAIH